AHHTPRGAGELVVILRLNAVNAVVIAVHIAKYSGQEGALLIIALGIGLRIDARAAGRFQRGVQLLGNVLIHLLRDDLIARVRVLDLAEHGIVIQVKRVGQNGRQRLLLALRADALVHFALADDRTRRHADAL